jgi:hypothetical protein
LRQPIFERYDVRELVNAVVSSSLLRLLTNMIHYTCDRCKREIDSETDLRYIVRIEVEAAMDEIPGDHEDDHDHLEDLQELLETADDYCESALSDECYQKKRYDLCSDCYRHYSKNPLGKETSTPFGFSKN